MIRMKESGIDWIGQIPEEWKISKIKFTTQLNGRIGWQGLTSAEYKEEGPYLITGTDFQNGTINFETAVHIDERRWSEASQIQVKNGDLLITKDGTVGKVAIISGLDGKASLNSGVLRIQTIEEIDRRFLYYVLLSDEFWMWFNYTNSGASTILHLYQNVFDEFTFTFPQKNEQQKIADYLDKKIAQLDRVKRLLEKQIQKLKDYRASLIYETVTKGLDKTVTMKDSGIDWIGQVPEGWEITKHKYIMTKVKEICAHYEGQDILSLTRQGVVVRDIESGKGKMPASFDGYQFLEKGDLLFCLFDIDVTPRCVGVVENNGLTSSAYSRFRLDDKISVYYYYYLFLSMDEDKVLLHLAKNLRHSLTEDDFGIIETILPSYEEQLRIADYLGKVTKSIDEIVQLKQKQIENINKQRQTLIYDYVTGKRRV